MDEVDETVRAAFADTYQKGYTDGYAAGIAAALEKIQSLAAENGVPVPSKEPSMDESVRILNLNIKQRNFLGCEGIHTIGDIYKLADDPYLVTYRLQGIRGLGRKTISEIREKLLERGYPEIAEPSS